MIIKVFPGWDPRLRRDFLVVYALVDAKTKDSQIACQVLANYLKEDHAFYFLTLYAFELRNLKAVAQLKKPHHPENFHRWFAMDKVPSELLWKTEVYQWCSRHPFSVNCRIPLKDAFNLIADDIEEAVRKHNTEHRDAHLANVVFIMRGDMPVKAHLFD